jgi:hypothetical protein
VIWLPHLPILESRQISRVFALQKFPKGVCQVDNVFVCGFVLSHFASEFANYDSMWFGFLFSKGAAL